MNTIRAIFLALVGAVLMIPGAVLAESTPLRCDDNGHHYEVIDFLCGSLSAKDCWEAAKLVAESRTYAGAFGKLATITSPAEQQCVAAAWSAWGVNKEVWIGGFQQQPANGVGDNWVWIDGDGVIPGTNQTDLYANWDQDLPYLEPNDLPSGHPDENGDEDHLGLGLFGVPTWNDEGAKGNIFGAAIEYETSTVIEDIGECLGEGCPLSDELKIIYEGIVCFNDMGEPDPNSNCSGATLEARSWQIPDPPGRCGDKLLNITELMDGNLKVEVSSVRDEDADTILPRHLCGHPNIVLTKTDVGGFKIGNTAAIIVSDPPTGNIYQLCGPLDLTDRIDNTVWDVTAYQTSEKADMVETDVDPAGVPQLFAGGTVLESLFECGSSRGKGFQDSWYFSGLCIAFGGEGCPTADPDLILNPLNFDQMNQFLIYKLNRIAEVLAEAKIKNAFVRNNDYKYLKKQVKQAIKQASLDEYESTFDHIENAQRRLATTRFQDVPDERYPAELDTRLSNAAFTSKERIVQYLSLP